MIPTIGTATAIAAMETRPTPRITAAATVVARMETLVTPTAPMETTGMQDSLTMEMATPTVTAITLESPGTGGNTGVIIAVVTTGAIISSLTRKKTAAGGGVRFFLHRRHQPAVGA